jgi:ketopantoate reductase
MLIKSPLNGVTIVWNAHKHEMLENRKVREIILNAITWAH